ncbi:MAG: hypothetical protein NXY57DRAFT_756400 [Lentinula lateritia]|nr:MAG: hypothetical protein NXY57DRAFT_756400 [Lentinula lateritia]
MRFFALFVRCRFGFPLLFRMVSSFYTHAFKGQICTDTITPVAHLLHKGPGCAYDFVIIHVNTICYHTSSGLPPSRYYFVSLEPIHTSIVLGKVNFHRKYPIATYVRASGMQVN